MTDPLIRDIPDVELSGELARLKPWFEAVKEALQIGSGVRKQAADDAWVRKRDLFKIGLTNRAYKPTAGAGTVGPPGPPGAPGGTYTPDLTAPPTAAGLVVTAGLSYLYIEHDTPVYTQGHGHDRTIVYGAKWPSGIAPTFTDAVPLCEFQGDFGAYPTDTGTRWCVWIKWRSIDGVLSADPAGGANGAQATTGKIGNADLNPLIIEAGNLADGAIDLTTNKVKASTNFGAIAVGYTVTQYLIATSGVMGNLVVDDAQIADLSAAKLTAGDGTIGGNLKSTNYVAGTSGWLLQPNGTAEFSAASIRGLLLASQIDTRGLTIKDSGGTVIFGSGTALDWSRVGGTGKPQTYRVNAQGQLTTTSPVGVGVYDATTGVQLHGVSGSGYHIVKINRATGATTLVMHEQPLNSGTGANIATALNVIGSDHIVVIYTTDEPSTSRLVGSPSLAAAIYRCGGSRGVFESGRFNYRCAYILIGVPGSGEGNGFELLEPYDGANSWVDTTFSVVNGNPVFSSGTSLLEINAGNVSTYIANAAINTAQVANLAVTNAKIANLAVDTAKIADLAVDTLKVAGDAVSVHATAQAANYASLTVSCAISVTMAYPGQVAVLAVYVPAGVFGSSSVANLTCPISGTAGYTGTLGVSYSISKGFPGVMTGLTGVDVVSAGTVTVTANVTLTNVTADSSGDYGGSIKLLLLRKYK